MTESSKSFKLVVAGTEDASNVDELRDPLPVEGVVDEGGKPVGSGGVSPNKDSAASRLSLWRNENGDWAL